MNKKKFTNDILSWFDKHGRHDLPWQHNPTPYRVWVSEIMLQQTQVTTVIPYFQKFMQSFPSLKKLALASNNQVLSHWSGLGYYARARNLHKTAKIIHEQYSGRFPKTITELCELPGIGRSTAGAILSLSQQVWAPILDGNVKRVLTRFFTIEGWPGNTKVLNELWNTAEKYTPTYRVNDYNQAMMDLGATICTRSRPKCLLCPLQKNCKAHQLGQAEFFPTKKTKPKTRRRKEIRLLLLQRSDECILLQKRPATGIWGGLLSLPECALDISPAMWCQQQFNLKAKTMSDWEMLSHSFSHFDLNIHPTHLRLTKISPRIMEDNRFLWHDLSQELPGGVAAPVKKLLNKLM